MRLAIVSAILLGACGGDPAAVETPVAGWEAVLVLEIPGSAADGSILLETVSSAVRLDDGSVVVADPFASALKFFSASGALVRTVGRHGRGPEEFTTISWVGMCGGRIVAFDGNTSEISVISRSGEFLSRFRASPLPTGSSTASFVRCAPDGSLAYAAFPRQLPRGCYPDTQNCPPMRTTMTLASADGEFQDSIGDVFAGDVRPLGRLVQFAVSDQALYVGTGESSAVDVYDRSGDLDATLQLDLPQRSPTSAHYERAMYDLVKFSPDRDWQRGAMEMLREVPMPEFMPPYSGVFADPDGYLWVEASIPGDTNTWLRPIDTAGRRGPDVVLSRGMDILDVRSGYLVGSFEHPETGEPHVLVYRLEPRR